VLPYNFLFLFEPNISKNAYLVKNINAMIELKIKVEEQLIHQFGKGKIEQYLNQMLEKLNRKEEADLIVIESKTSLLDGIELSDEAVLFIKQHDLKANIEAVLVRIADFFEDYTIKIEHRVDVEEGFETLFIYIITDLPTKNASLQIRQMFKGWKLLKNKAFIQKVAIITRRHDTI